MSDKKVKILDGRSFQETVSKGTSLVDFWAEWCGPCLQQGPIIDELAGKVEDGVNVCKVDVDTNQDIATKYEVTSIPTLLVFKDGEVVKRFVGVQSLKTLQEAL